MPIKTCPHCKTPMKQNQIFGITLDECPNCYGTWLDKGEIETLISHAKKQNHNPEERENLINNLKQNLTSSKETTNHKTPDSSTPPPTQLETCPNCSNKMRHITRFSVEIDICQSCYGIWCDPNEANLLHSHAQHNITIQPKNTPDSPSSITDTKDFYNWINKTDNKHCHSLSLETENWLKDQNSSDQAGILEGIALFGYIFTKDGVRKRRLRDMFWHDI